MLFLDRKNNFSSLNFFSKKLKVGHLWILKKYLWKTKIFVWKSPILDMHEIFILAQISVSAFLTIMSYLGISFNLFLFNIFLVKAIKYKFFIVLLNKQWLLNNFYYKYWKRSNLKGYPKITHYCKKWTSTI